MTLTVTYRPWPCTLTLVCGLDSAVTSARFILTQVRATPDLILILPLQRPNLTLITLPPLNLVLALTMALYPYPGLRPRLGDHLRSFFPTQARERILFDSPFPLPWTFP